MEIQKKSETKKCLKCGYERGLSESAPEYECPKCGRIYEKVEKSLCSGSANGTSQPLKQSVSCLQKKKETRWISVSFSAFKYLLIVIFTVFVIVFASLTVPGFMAYQCRSKQNEAKYNLKAIAKNEEAYRIKFNRYSKELSEIGFAHLSQGKLRYEYYIEYASADKFKAVAKSKHPGIRGKRGEDDIWTIDETHTLLNTVRGCG